MCKLGVGAWYHRFLVLPVLRNSVGPRAQMLVESSQASRKVEPQVVNGSSTHAPAAPRGARQMLGVLVDVLHRALAALIEERF